ncbi:small neutral amino acid transporter SnatA (MarC family) [Bradyrhizobium japonicum]|uniref:Small neutral amino acid transporter SnatA (MarC family) n=1 Tax=Bradyrhizobium japonicum TaxID=375 RepID=A0ABV2S2T3_BRAJP
MTQQFSLFVGTFTTLLAIINPFEVLPVYLAMLSGKDNVAHRSVARRSAFTLCFFAFSSCSLARSCCGCLTCP